MARYLGVDLHRNNFTVCTIAENGRRYFREYGIHSLDYFVGRLRPADQVAVEVSTTTRLFHDAVAPHVERVAVVNSSQFDVIRKSVKKTDRNDAETLALFLSKGLISGEPRDLGPRSMGKLKASHPRGRERIRLSAPSTRYWPIQATRT